MLISNSDVVHRCTTGFESEEDWRVWQKDSTVALSTVRTPEACLKFGPFFADIRDAKFCQQCEWDKKTEPEIGTPIV